MHSPCFIILFYFAMFACCVPPCSHFVLPCTCLSCLARGEAGLQAIPCWAPALCCSHTRCNIACAALMNISTGCITQSLAACGAQNTRYELSLAEAGYTRKDMDDSDDADKGDSADAAAS